MVLKQCLRTGILTVHFVLLIVALSSAQKLIEVGVSNFRFTPPNIEITTGDTVRWTNTQGTHNVNGTTEKYPDNPESFGNSVAGPGWVYIYVFNSAGTYNYNCDPHESSGMKGVIEVKGTIGIKNILVFGKNSMPSLRIEKVSGYYKLELDWEGLSEKRGIIAVIFDVKGRELFRRSYAKSEVIAIDTRHWSKSLHFIHLIHHIDKRTVQILPAIF